MPFSGSQKLVFRILPDKPLKKLESNDCGNFFSRWISRAWWLGCAGLATIDSGTTLRNHS
jgi:hypothetical protein